MSDQPEAQYDASRVMLNGAAIGLVSSLVNGMEVRLRNEIHAVEQRQSDELKVAVLALSGDVTELEQWRRSEMDARQRRDGQLSVLAAVGSFLVRYDKVILGIGIGIAAGLIGALQVLGS